MHEDQPLSIRERYGEITEGARDSLSGAPDYLFPNGRGKISYEPDGPEGLSRSHQRLAGMLFDSGIVKFGNFKLALHEGNSEAPLSPIYIDLHLLKRHPIARNAALRIYRDMVEPLKFDLLADVPTAATPIVASLSERMGTGMISPRSRERSHGPTTSIDGLLPNDESKTVLVVEGVVSNATSSSEAVSTLRRAGLKVKDLAALIDSQRGGRERLQGMDVKLHSVLILQQMLDFYHRLGMISPEEYRRINEENSKLSAYLGVTS